MGRERDPNNDPRNEDIFALDREANADDEAVWRLLNVYADGEATPEEAARVEALLRADPARGQDLAFLRMTAESARSLTEVEPPETLRQAIFAATIHRSTFRRRVAAGWDAVCRAVASPAGRYALPAGALAAAGIAAMILLPRAASPPAQIALRALLPAGKGVFSPLPGRHDSARQARSGGKPSALAMVTPGLLGAQEMVSAVVASLQSAPAARPGPEKPESLPRIFHAPAPASVSAKRPPTERLVLRPASWQTPSVSAPPFAPLHRKPVQVATYAFQPGMDMPNQHARVETDAGMLTDADVRVSSADAASKPDASPSSQPPRVHWGHLLITELPPSPGPSLAELKRGRMAATLGYDRETLEHIERHQAAVSLIDSKF